MSWVQATYLESKAACLQVSKLGTQPALVPSMQTKIQIAVFHLSTRIAIIEAEPAIAWRSAVAYVRSMAHGDGIKNGPGWYQTANRAGYQRGAYRCTPVRADRK